MLRRIDLKVEEKPKYEIIKDLVDQNGNKLRAASRLSCSMRTINRYIKGYKEYGKAFFKHGNSGKKPAHAIPIKVKERIVEVYKTKYYDATYQHFTELLEEFENIKVSEPVVRKTLMAEYILSVQATKETRKSIKKQLEDKKKETSNPKELNRLQEKIIDIEEAHARRPRCKNFGEMQQMDACKHPWFDGIKATLHIAVDDATSSITGAWFDKEETLNGYYHVFEQILREHGIPYMFYTDRRTVFEYKKSGQGLDENDTLTQFAYACKALGVDIKTTSVAQAKGRVERMFKTLQLRLPVLLRLANITSIEQANAFLKSYLPKFNKRFALDPEHIPSVFEKQPSEEKINLTLAVLTRREVDHGHSIRFMNKYYRTVNCNGYPEYFRKGTEGLVIKTLDNNLYFSIEDKIYSLDEIPEHERVSKNFDVKETSKPVRRYIPSMSHPWKKASFERFQQKQAHRATA